MIPRDKRRGLGYTFCIMNRTRATFFYWYFSNGSRWQPEGRV
jgi:hypothetical protein